jgi:hypothetical protein
MAAFSTWAATIEALAAAEAQTTAVWARLNAEAPEGWLPESADDAVLTKIFDAAWPCALSVGASGEKS